MGLCGNFTKYPGPWISVAQTSLDFTCMEWSLLIYRFSQAIKSELTFFFPRMSQGHNTLTRPGLEPGLSNSEPSALTTGLLYKAVALTCPRYSWPCMLKVTPCTVVQSYSCTVLQLYSLTVVQSYIQIFSARWVTTIFYNYGATLCKLCYNLCVFCKTMNGKT